MSTPFKTKTGDHILLHQHVRKLVASATGSRYGSPG